jgi:hypothetical protein
MYNSEACLTTAELDDICAESPDHGTFVNYGVVSSSADINAPGDLVRVYPNPASDRFVVDIDTDLVSDGQIRIIDARGQIMASRDIEVEGRTNFQMDASQLAAGIYFVTVRIRGDLFVTKVFVQ